MRKRLKGDYIAFTGESSNDVTGSQYYLEFANKKY